MSGLLSIKNQSVSRVVSGTTMIAGTAIGAGMLGIPLLTGTAGFWPSLFITGVVWVFMLCTGLLFLEVALWMPEGANILSMANRFFGNKGKILAGTMFIFLYYCLMVAYFAGGAPLFGNFINAIFGLNLPSFINYVFFGLIFGAIVAIGPKCIDRVNIILTINMVIAFGALVGFGCSDVQVARLEFNKWSAVIFAVPLLFSAFGYHNIVPSLCTYLNRERKSLKLSIFLGTSIPFIFYLIWQWLIIGAVPQEALTHALALGQPATQALEAASGSTSIYLVGQCFAFFAIVTSMLGVAFSLVDFLGDGLKINREKMPQRSFLTILTFFPPFLCVVFDPSLFDKALGIAGGFGEAFLNGLLPVMLVWMGRYAQKLPSSEALPGGRITLVALCVASVFVIYLEILILVK